MMRFNKLLPMMIFALVGFFCQPVIAQGWVKAGKAVSKQAVKAIKNNSSKTTKLIRPDKKSATSTVGVSKSAAVASQYTTTKCSSCSGRGWYTYNGYNYTCSSCSGRGYKVIKRQ